MRGSLYYKLVGQETSPVWKSRTERWNHKFNNSTAPLFFFCSILKAFLTYVEFWRKPTSYHVPRRMIPLESQQPAWLCVELSPVSTKLCYNHTNQPPHCFEGIEEQICQETSHPCVCPIIIGHQTDKSKAHPKLWSCHPEKNSPPCTLFFKYSKITEEIPWCSQFGTSTPRWRLFWWLILLKQPPLCCTCLLRG